MNDARGSSVDLPFQNVSKDDFITQAEFVRVFDRTQILPDYCVGNT
jgi:hypothetical protein